MDKPQPEIEAHTITMLHIGSAGDPCGEIYLTGYSDDYDFVALERLIKFGDEDRKTTIIITGKLLDEVIETLNKASEYRRDHACKKS